MNWKNVNLKDAYEREQDFLEKKIKRKQIQKIRVQKTI